MSKVKLSEVGGSRTYRPWKDWEEGEYVGGKYIKQSVDKFGKDNYAIEVEDTNIPTLKNGEVMVLNSNGSLDYKMGEVEIGDYVQVEYTGKQVLDKGPFAGKEAHTVKVLSGKYQNESNEESDLDL